MEKRRELVEARRPQEPADSCHARRVVLRAGLVGPRRTHGAELDKLERAAAAAAPGLTEEHGRTVEDPHHQGNGREQRDGDDEQCGRDDEVDRPLHHDRDPTVTRRLLTARPSGRPVPARASAPRPP